MVMEYLSRTLQLRCTSPFSYHVGCRDLGITHVMFADDLFCFSKGDRQSVQILCDCLDHFYRVSGLQLNAAKSKIFFSGVDDV
ncbi:reverse transcriptase domain-containing protein, partial [Vibrio vulnificus]|uniref:reverse transcriptase domain-containing protein n=1 Tax=Vibrio vulnificus TaxID=672 RepID=UPI003BFA6A2A